MSDDKTVVPGYVRGYRLWSRGHYLEQPYLHGVAHQAAWRSTGPMEARCSYLDTHLPPSPRANCRCGLYAKYLPQDMYGSFRGSIPKIPGIIDAWGNTILGTYGFRAQKAVIRALWVDPTIEPFIRAAGEFYQVPVFFSVDEALEAFPPTDVSELVDTRPSVRVVDLGPSNHAAGMTIDLSQVAVTGMAARYREQYLAATRKAFNLPPELIPGGETK